MYRPYPPRWITKKNDSFRLETHCSSPSSSTHSAPAADFSISAWPWRAAEGRISFFHKRTQKSTGSRLPACGSTSTSWKLPVLSESSPESPHANQTDMSFVRAGSCHHRPFARVPPWLYVVNLSRMETRAVRKKSHWLCLLERVPADRTEITCAVLIQDWHFSCAKMNQPKCRFIILATATCFGRRRQSGCFSTGLLPRR